MLEVHRWRQIEWGPSAVVALATSVNGTVVAAARENGAIELWKVAPGSVGWHCHLCVPGKENAAISSLIWCKASEKHASPLLGRLFSAGLDGFITEWDLQTLQPKGIIESYGGSVWQLAAEPLINSVRSLNTGNGNPKLEFSAASASDSDDSSIGSDSEDDGDVAQQSNEQRVAVGCDDGCLRLFSVADGHEGMLYRRSFPRVKGRILSVAWSADGSRVFSGGSDGCIHCWDSFKLRELFRITAGIGGRVGVSELCVWSLLTLRDGTIVSGDSSGSTQFWEGKHGTLLQAHANHAADVLALAASPSHQGVFAAGADGQVILYQHVKESSRTATATTSGSANMTVEVLADKWIYVGSKRTHTHDVRALALAVPLVHDEGYVHVPLENKGKRIRKKGNMKGFADYKKQVEEGAAMLISGGSDAKLFTYPANAFLAFHPHDICPAPQRPHVQLAVEAGTSGGTVFMAQHTTWVDVWQMHANANAVLDVEEGLEQKQLLGKRKMRDEGNSFSRKFVKSNGSLTTTKAGLSGTNGWNDGSGIRQNEVVQSKGIAPALVARIKCKTAEHISCSAISSNGRYLAFSDRLKPRLYVLGQMEQGISPKRLKSIVKKRLPESLPAAQSMQFTPDSTRLLLGSSFQIMVIDVDNSKVLHTFQVVTPSLDGQVASMSPIEIICTSTDSQWLAATTSSGHIHVYNLETLRYHWSVPVLDGSVATAAVFRPGSSNVLIVSTSANEVHVFDVEAKELSEWSKVNGVQLSQHLLEFPGPIIGLSVPPTPTSTSVIAYSSRAMCQIDFCKQLKSSALGGNEFKTKEFQTPGMNMKSAGAGLSSAKKSHDYANGNGVRHESNGDSNVNSNFVVVNFKDSVLFLGHTSSKSLLVLEKSWLEVLKQFQPPIFRHLYGT